MKNPSTLLRSLLLLVVALAIPLTAAAQTSPAYDRGPELDPEKDYFALIKTNHGDFALKLFPDIAPITVRNFVNLAEGTREYRDVATGLTTSGKPFYDGLTFHRVISNFMVQAGCPRGNGTGDPGYRFRDEFDPSVNFDRPGLLAKANSGPNTNGSQFFITEVPTPHLNQRHTIFGEVLPGSGGVDLVKKIASVPKNNRDVPNEPVVMEQVIIKRLPKGTPADEALPLVLEATRNGDAPTQAEEAAAEPEVEATEED